MAADKRDAQLIAARLGELHRLARFTNMTRFDFMEGSARIPASRLRE